MPEIQAPAVADGFDINNYNFVIYASNIAPCSASYKGGNTIFAAAVERHNWTAYAHELQLAHANRADCEENGVQVSWGGTLTSVEYGDGFSVMGWDGGLGHFSAVEKLRLGTWEMGREVIDVKRSGIYSLKPVTTSTTQGGRRGLRIRSRTNPLLPNGKSVYGPFHSSEISYYVELRTETGFNRITQQTAGENVGVYVRVGVGEEHYQKPFFLDMDLQSPKFSFPEGVWHTDSVSQVRFRVVAGSLDDTGVEIEVDLGIPDEPGPTDYNRDGLTDIAFHRPGGNWQNVPTLFSNGDGSWSWPSTAGPAPSWANVPGVVAVPGYFDPDGFIDVAFYQPGNYWNSIPVLLNNGDGTWRDVNTGAPSWAQQLGFIAVPGRFNEDDLTDIAFYRPGSDWSSVPVLLSDGDGTWTGVNYLAPSWANQPDVVAIAGDFDGGGLTDLAFHRPGSTWNSVPVLFSQGGGAWRHGNWVVPSWANQPGVIAVAGHSNRDERTDIAFHRPGSSWSSVPVLLSNGDDGSWEAHNYVTPNWANETGVIAIPGHFDDDTTTDIAFHLPGGSWNTLPILLSNGDGDNRDDGDDGLWFSRGECNNDDKVDLSDAICTLKWMYRGEAAPPCIAATNTNGDATVNLADPLALIKHLYVGNAAPAAPFPDCGSSDLEADKALGCKVSPRSVSSFRHQQERERTGPGSSDKRAGPESFLASTGVLNSETVCGWKHCER